MVYFFELFGSFFRYTVSESWWQNLTRIVRKLWCSSIDFSEISANHGTNSNSHDKIGKLILEFVSTHFVNDKCKHGDSAAVRKFAGARFIKRILFLLFETVFSQRNAASIRSYFDERCIQLQLSSVFVNSPVWSDNTIVERASSLSFPCKFVLQYCVSFFFFFFFFLISSIFMRQ